MMKYLYISLLAAFIFAMGCVYEEPFAKHDNSRIDEKLLGHWKFSEDNKDKGKIEMLIMKYSDTEYLVKYITGDNPFYFRAYNVTIGDIKAVQVQWIGLEKGILEQDSRKYNLLKYTLDRDSLEIRFINDSLISKDIRNSSTLRDKVMENSKNPGLFNIPGKFERVKKL